MKHIHLAALELDCEFAKSIGKKGSESDFCIYNCKEGGEVICLYHPSKYPDKIQPLLYCLSLADAAYIRPTQIDKVTGEMIVACAVFGKRLIAIVDRVSREEIEPLIKAAGVAEYEFFEGDANQLRQKLLTIPSTRKQDGKTEVAIDSCFPVKGVGTVALGIVQQGKCSVHQKLFFLPSGVESEVRTIQVQDENVTEADTGSRVGLGLKGIEPESVGKGDLAVEEKFAATSAVHANATLTKFYKGNLEAVQFFVFSCLNSVASKAKKTADGKYEIALSAPMPIRAGEKIVLFVPEAMPRVVGSAVVEKVV